MKISNGHLVIQIGVLWVAVFAQAHLFGVHDHHASDLEHQHYAFCLDNNHKENKACCTQIKGLPVVGNNPICISYQELEALLKQLKELK